MGPVLDLVEHIIDRRTVLLHSHYSSGGGGCHCTMGQSPKGMVVFLELAIVRVAGC